jgi:pimeloyl-ACP methyl ester carboxylesterase
VPVVVFLHAFPLNSEMWRPQLEALPRGWEALCPDFRGFGGAPAADPGGPRPTDAALEDYVADVLRLLDAEGVDRAVFCGCSMGGYTALAVLRRHPGRVAGLVLADTRATADGDPARANRLAMLDLLDREGPPAVVAQMLPKLVGATTRLRRPGVMDAAARMAARATGPGIGHAVVRMLNRPDSTAALAAFTGPVLVVVGAEDELSPPAEAEAMAAVPPNARFVVVPEAGHLANLESPDAFNAALGTFLREQPGARPEPQIPNPNTSGEP